MSNYCVLRLNLKWKIQNFTRISIRWHGFSHIFIYFLVLFIFVGITQCLDAKHSILRTCYVVNMVAETKYTTP